MSTRTNPLALLNATEQALTEQVRRATAAVERIATDDLDAVIGEYESAVLAAKARLKDCRDRIAYLAGGLLGQLEADLLTLEVALDEHDRGGIEVPLLEAPAPIVPLDEVLAAEAEADEQAQPVPCRNCGQPDDQPHEQRPGLCESCFLAEERAFAQADAEREAELRARDEIDGYNESLNVAANGPAVPQDAAADQGDPTPAPASDRKPAKGGKRPKKAAAR